MKTTHAFEGADKEKKERAVSDESDDDGRSKEVSADDGDAPARDERTLLAMFVGPNAERYLMIYDSNYGGQAARKVFSRAKANFIAGFFPLPWFFYRKLYLEGTALILLPFLLGYLFPNFAGKGISGMFVAIIIIANDYYVNRALRKIARIEKSGEPIEKRDARIRRAGGVSIAGAVVGAVIFAGTAGLAILVKFAPQYLKPTAMALPPCDAPQIKTMVSQVVHNNDVAPWMNNPAFKHMNFEETEPATDSTRQCSFTIVANGQSIPLHFTIQWNDAGKKQVKVEVHGRLRRSRETD